ncbi:MAG: flagellar hook-associated protein FlgK [Thiomicrorhabdus chilensis]|uniref:flagellar hook-associated protein FlgK n=1 Tax=Thiomicrorhabdus chilensis TaxID=63656 RepID=UPI00299E7060|nr:flagellar hook-associated protein FlgK [Thiomicrorhabdus chilensis]MDX1346899.1 flagellar hook-associated protein FlgK [Thiomicrorhabdus chilensis]
MADMLSIGSNAANTYKTALDVTSHNVANVGTEGYSRQRAEISSNTAGIIGPIYNGGGSSVDTVLRIQAGYIQTQLNSSNASVQRYDQQLQLSKQVEGVIASNDEGIQEFMQRFFDSMQNLANNPTSDTSRQMLLEESGNLESHIGNLNAVLVDTEKQVNTQVTNLVGEVNDRLQTIHAINKEVTRSLDTGAQPPNDLLDQRDQAILELSGYIDIKTFPQSDGRIDIHTANGQLPLLSDNTITPLKADLSPYTNDNRMEVYMNIGGTDHVISNRISGGQLGGVLDFRSNMLDQAQNDLGLTLNGLVSSVNWQHYQGWDLNGDPGQEFFAPLQVNGALGADTNVGSEDGSNISVSFNPNATVSEPPYTNNVSAVTPPTNLDDQPQTYGEKEGYLNTALSAVGEFVAREYIIKSDGNNPASFSFYDYKTGEDISGTAVEVPANSGRFQLDGLEFDLSTIRASGTTGAGDSFLVKPHQAMLDQFETMVQDTNELATRGQSSIEATVDNDGDGTIEPLEDRIPGPAAYGDNVNMANLANLQSKSLLFSDGSGQPTETLLGGYSKMASNAGMYVRGTEIQLTAQTNVYDQMMNQRESISGVSLDEEAANLMRFQQAYEASAQIIATSQSIFQTLLGAVRG